MKLLAITVVVCIALHHASALRQPRMRMAGHHSQLLSQQKLSAGYDYRTFYIDQRIDQFSWSISATYKQRYLLADQFFKPGGPILFYTGNEGAIDWFCNNTGFMWDIAPDFGGLLVFAEHRYYGESLPFGNESFSSPDKSGYLTVEQALADFATLILYLKRNASYADSPVIAFGGSYGGMLSAYFRMKYPEIVLGSLAASAPIWQFRDFVPCDTFAQIVKRTFLQSDELGAQCVANIAASWQIIDQLGASSDGQAQLTKTFSLCQPIASVANVTTFKDWLVDIYGNLAMADYPYPAGFLEPLPGWPVKEFCQNFKLPPATSANVLHQLASALGVYFNYTGGVTCYDYLSQASSSLSDKGWDFQTCTEMTMPMCANDDTDIFYPSKWDLAAYSAYCQRSYNVTPDVDRIVREFGGLNINQYSNIIFSNGNLDPWSGGGVNKTLSDSLVAIWIQQGAHHLDLRATNPLDPQSVRDARALEVKIIKSWLLQYRREKNNRRNLASKKLRFVPDNSL